VTGIDDDKLVATGTYDALTCFRSTAAGRAGHGQDAAALPFSDVTVHKVMPRMLVTPDKVRLLKFGFRGVRGVPLIFILQNQKVRLKIK
jgi:hypothetical protein